jgi:hypothetical protein
MFLLYLFGIGTERMLKKGIILFPPNAIVNTGSLPWYNGFSECHKRSCY